MPRTKSKGLSPKQQQVLEGLKAGKHPTVIAKEMGISINGVYQHKRRITQAGHTFPRVIKAKRGRPPGKAKAAAMQSAAETEMKGLSARAEPLTVEQRVDKEVELSTNRITAIGAEILKLTGEQQALEDRYQRLVAAQTALRDAPKE